MSYLVDSDFTIDVFHEQPHAIAMLPTLFAAGISVSVISEIELWEGVYTARNPDMMAKTLRQFLRGVRVIPLSRPIARRCARLRGDLRTRKRPITHRALDLILAANVLHYRVELARHSAQCLLVRA